MRRAIRWRCVKAALTRMKWSRKMCIFQRAWQSQLLLTILKGDSLINIATRWWLTGKCAQSAVTRARGRNRGKGKCRGGCNLSADGRETGINGQLHKYNVWRHFNDTRDTCDWLLIASVRCSIHCVFCVCTREFVHSEGQLFGTCVIGTKISEKWEHLALVPNFEYANYYEGMFLGRDIFIPLSFRRRLPLSPCTKLPRFLLHSNKLRHC